MFSIVKRSILVKEEVLAFTFGMTAVILVVFFYIHVVDQYHAPVRLGVPQAVDVIQVGCLRIHKGDLAEDALTGTERLELEVEDSNKSITKTTMFPEPSTHYYRVDGGLYAIEIANPKGSYLGKISGIWDVTPPSGKSHQEKLAHTPDLCTGK